MPRTPEDIREEIEELSSQRSELEDSAYRDERPFSSSEMAQWEDINRRIALLYRELDPVRAPRTTSARNFFADQEDGSDTQ